MGGVNLLMHGAGWMEGGLHASYEKMILDAELLGMVAAFLDPVVVDDETLAFSTRCRRSAPAATSSAPSTPSRATGPRSTSRCSATGGTTRPGRRPARPRLPAKANRIWKELLAAYEPPPMDPAIHEELEAFVARRVAEGGVPTDY